MINSIFPDRDGLIETIEAFTEDAYIFSAPEIDQ